jgi:hypothetical protein
MDLLMLGSTLFGVGLMMTETPDPFWSSLRKTSRNYAKSDKVNMRNVENHSMPVPSMHALGRIPRHRCLLPGRRPCRGRRCLKLSGIFRERALISNIQRDKSKA